MGKFNLQTKPPVSEGFAEKRNCTTLSYTAHMSAGHSHPQLNMTFVVGGGSFLGRAQAAIINLCDRLKNISRTPNSTVLVGGFWVPLQLI